jgi:hypothetical protein
MVMGVFESRQDGQIPGIEDLGSGVDQPVQAMGVLRDRHDPFIADGDGLVDRAMLGHGVNVACTDQQVRQARSTRRRGRRQVLVHRRSPAASARYRCLFVDVSVGPWEAPKPMI